MANPRRWNGAPLDLLSREEEIALIRRAAAGDRGAEDRLVRSQLRLSVRFARTYASGDDLEDLIQQGALGIVHAVRQFDPDRGVRLSSYAAWWIRAYQLRYLMANHRLVRIGSTQAQRKAFWNLRSERARLSAAGFEAPAEALAEALGIEASVADEMAGRMDKRELSLDVSPAHGMPLAETLANDSPDAESIAARGELVEIVRGEADRLRAELGERDRALFDARFADDDTSLATLGKRFGISRERARQLESRVLGKLRHRVERRLAA